MPTPGPWRVDDSAAGALEVVQDSHGDIAMVRGNRAGVGRANARLIAAAPEMFEALRATLEYWEVTGFAECHPGCNCIVESVRAALASVEEP